MSGGPNVGDHYLFLIAAFLRSGLAQYQVPTNEVFMIPLQATRFNLSSHQEFIIAYSDTNIECFLWVCSFNYKASLHGLPDLPKWIQLVYNPMLKMGFLFGTPPSNLETVKLDIAVSNQFTFETATKELTLEIFPNPDPAEREIKMKIHNLNVEDMMDQTRLDKLFDVFRITLWPESSSDLHLLDLHSALTVGGRRPARREDGEGVVLTLGSKAEFSEVLQELEREVSPLWHSFKQCPRDFKKTSAERYFRNKGFLVDWCSFKLIPQNSSLAITSSTVSTDPDGKTDSFIVYPSSPNIPEDGDLWRSPAKWEIPRRSYAEEGVVAIFIPLVILLVLTALLTAILGVHPEGSETEEGQLYEGVFEELLFVKSKKTTEVSPSKGTSPEMIPMTGQRGNTALLGRESNLMEVANCLSQIGEKSLEYQTLLIGKANLTILHHQMDATENVEKTCETVQQFSLHAAADVQEILKSFMK
nr:EOG090X04W0 [Eurycercus lamellatus]